MTNRVVITTDDGDGVAITQREGDGLELVLALTIEGHRGQIGGGLFEFVASMVCEMEDHVSSNDANVIEAESAFLNAGVAFLAVLKDYRAMP